MEAVCYELVPSAYGPIAIAWREANGGVRVRQVLLSDGTVRAEDRLAKAYPDCRFASHPALSRPGARRL